jgi:hypothetical protein
MKALLTAGLTCTLVAGCYTYRPLASVDAAMPPPGTQIEARLTTGGATALASQIGPDVLILQGQVVSADSTGLTLAVNHSETARRVSSDWKGEHVTLPREDIASLEGRKFSVGGTALLGGLAGGGIVATFALLGGTGTGAATGVGSVSQGRQ